MQYTINVLFFFLGIFDFDLVSKSKISSPSTSRKRIRIRIAVQHQNACVVAGRILRSSENDNNKVYLKNIDNFYVKVHAIRRRDGVEQLGT